VVDVRSLLVSVIAAAALAGCAGGAPSTPGPRGPGGGEIALGDYAKLDEARLSGAFAGVVSQRYPAGIALAAAVADLGRNKFSCGAPRPVGKAAAAGDPPAQVCRRVIEAGGCTHTWQVHLFEGGPAKPEVSRARGLYDRACGNDDLLGK
jgi:hypothetical protein